MKIKRFQQFNESLEEATFEKATTVKELYDKIADNITSGWLGSDGDLDTSYEFAAVEDANVELDLGIMGMSEEDYEGGVIYNGWSEDLQELAKDNEELKAIADKMEECYADMWEHDLNSTKQGILIETAEYFNGEEDVKIEYNGWWNDLWNLAKEGEQNED